MPAKAVCMIHMRSRTSQQELLERHGSGDKHRLGKRGHMYPIISAPFVCSLAFLFLAAIGFLLYINLQTSSEEQHSLSSNTQDLAHRRSLHPPAQNLISQPEGSKEVTEGGEPKEAASVGGHSTNEPLPVETHLQIHNDVAASACVAEWRPELLVGSCVGGTKSSKESKVSSHVRTTCMRFIYICSVCMLTVIMT